MLILKAVAVTLVVVGLLIVVYTLAEIMFKDQS